MPDFFERFQGGAEARCRQALPGGKIDSARSENEKASLEGMSEAFGSSAARPMTSENAAREEVGRNLLRPFMRGGDESDKR